LQLGCAGAVYGIGGEMGAKEGGGRLVLQQD
jgi:hypothetical protein